MNNFKKVQTEDRLIQQLQENIATALSQLINLPILSGNLIEVEIKEVGTDLAVNHFLGRKYLTYIVAERFNNIEITTSPNNNAYPEKQVVIQGDSLGRVKLYIY